MFLKKYHYEYLVKKEDFVILVVRAHFNNRVTFLSHNDIIDCRLKTDKLLIRNPSCVSRGKIIEKDGIINVSLRFWIPWYYYIPTIFSLITGFSEIECERVLWGTIPPMLITLFVFLVRWGLVCLRNDFRRTVEKELSLKRL